MNKKALSIESLFVMVLFMVFAVSMVMMIISGRNSYGKILDEREQAEDLRIATSYLRMKLKQNNQVDSVFTSQSPQLGEEVLEIWQDGEEKQYRTVIYFRENKIWEAYMAAEDEFDFALGEPVIELDMESVHFNRTEKGIWIIYDTGREEIRQFVALQAEE